MEKFPGIHSHSKKKKKKKEFLKVSPAKQIPNSEFLILDQTLGVLAQSRTRLIPNSKFLILDQILEEFRTKLIARQL